MAYFRIPGADTSAVSVGDKEFPVRDGLAFVDDDVAPLLAHTGWEQVAAELVSAEGKQRASEAKRGGKA